MSAISQQQQAVIDMYEWQDYDVIDPDVVVEYHHANGVADVYIARDGAIYVEEGDDLDGFEMVPLEDSFLASRFGQ